MRTTSSRISAKATAAAVLSVLLFAATGSTPSWPDSSERIVTSDFITESFGTPDRYPTISGTSTVWVGTIATPSLCTNASYNCTTLDYVQDCAVACLGGYTIVAYLPTADASITTSIPDGRTTATTTTTRTSRRNRRMTTDSTTLATSADKNDPFLAPTSRTICFHDKFDGAAQADTSNESRWRRFQQEPLRLPDRFMARFLNTLMYLAEVITADVISAFLFGRWRPRYYQRARKNKLDRARRRRYRRFMTFATDVGMVIWDACIRLHDTLCPIRDDAASPTCNMVSNVQLAEDPAILSTVADLSTSEVAATVASASCSALVSIGSLSSPNLVIPGLPLLKSNKTQRKATTTKVPTAISTLVPRLLAAPAMSEQASCHPKASLPDSGLDIALPSAVSHRSPLLLEAAPPTAAPSRFSTIGVPADGHKELTLRAPRLSASLLPSSTAVSNDLKRRQNTTIMPIMRDSTTERECLAVPGVNHFKEGLASSPSPTTPVTRKHRLTIKASEPISANAEGMVNSLVMSTTAERSVITPMEEFGGPADDADDTPPAPFFISEHYTPESTCYISAHGVAYTTITMSYVHRANLPTCRGSQDDTPTTTQTGDVSDILFPASDARLRCKWSRECIQTMSSEYYRSSVEAVFVARFIPDETDMAVLSDLVTRHL